MAIQRGSRDEFSRGELREKQENQKQYQVLCHPTVTQNLGHSLALLFLALRPSKPHIYKKKRQAFTHRFFISKLEPSSLLCLETCFTASF
ncbi:hypothetical protein C9J22_07455 [Photobacterium phosphoreum]|nr:hypothetical protein C9J22_07455 [Photobacterium phosphoreum]